MPLQDDIKKFEENWKESESYIKGLRKKAKIKTEAPDRFKEFLNFIDVNLEKDSSPEAIDYFLWRHFQFKNHLKRKKILKKIHDKTRMGIRDLERRVKEIIKEIRERNSEKTKTKEKKPEKIPDLLKKKNLIDILIEETDKKIEGEIDTRKTIIAIKCGELVMNKKPTSTNLLLSEDTGIGKDWTTKKTLELFPKENRLHKAKLSPEVLAYWHNGTNDPDWTWDGKSLYLEEISFKTLNSDTLTAFLSNENFSGIVMINQVPVDLVIRGKPSIFITTASKNPKKDQLRRLPSCQLDDSIDQTKEIVKRQCRCAETGESLSYDPKVTDALRHLKRIRVKIPFAKKFGEALMGKVKIHRILRTNNDRFLDIIKFFTALYQHQRDKDKEGYHIATYEDYENALPVLEKMTQTITTVPLTKEKRKILDVIKELGEDVFWTVSELEAKVTFCSKQTIYTRLQELADDGFLIQDKVSRFDKREREYKSLAYKTSNIEELRFPTLEEIKMERNLESVESVDTVESLESLESAKNKGQGLSPVVSTVSTDSKNKRDLEV